MSDLGFRHPVLDDAEVKRLNEQRARVRDAILRSAGACPAPGCGRPRTEWPLIFRGDKACSVNCHKALLA